MSREDLKNAKRIVVKIGTTTLTRDNGELNLERISKLSWILSDIINQEKEVILVSSGAIAVGTKRLGLTTRPRDTKGKQATSAVGQAVLMQIYQNLFMQYNQCIAQILLTKDVLEDATRKENARNTFFSLFDLKIIPIVNENDTISVEELEFSDNDNLSSYVACLVDADLLIILSDIDGLYDKDPKSNKDANIISLVNVIDESIYSIAGDSSSSLGTGGMHTKISASERASKKNIKTVIASGEDPTILFDILEGKNVGTLFDVNLM